MTVWGQVIYLKGCLGCTELTENTTNTSNIAYFANTLYFEICFCVRDD